MGATAAVPGIGLITGSAAVAAESVLFLDLAAFYAVAAAYLRGEDIKDPEQRRAIVLTTLMGSKGVAIVDALLGDDAGKIPGKHTLAKFSGPGLAEANNILTRAAMRSMRKSQRRAWLGKLLPLGLGAVAGTTANRKLADAVVANIQDTLGPTPAAFAEPLPTKEEQDADEREAGVKFSTNPREFAAWILQLFDRGDKNDKNNKEAENDDE